MTLLSMVVLESALMFLIFLYSFKSSSFSYLFSNFFSSLSISSVIIVDAFLNFYWRLDKSSSKILLSLFISTPPFSVNFVPSIILNLIAGSPSFNCSSITNSVNFLVSPFENYSRKTFSWFVTLTRSFIYFTSSSVSLFVSSTSWMVLVD